MTSLDDALQGLKDQFRRTLPERMAQILEAYQQLSLHRWKPEKVEVLHRRLHSLTGGAGTFGMPSLSAAARQLEAMLKSVSDQGVAPEAERWSFIGTELRRLEQLALSQLHSSALSLAPPSVVPRLNRTPRVHLVEDDPDQANYLAKALSEEGFQVRIYTQLESYRASFDALELPDAIVLDMIFPEADDAGARLLKQLKAEREDCPPVVFVSVRDDLKARLIAYRAGASRYMLKPVKPKVLADVLDALTGRIPSEPYRVLLVDDDPMLLSAQSAVLEAAGIAVQAVSDPIDTLEILDSFRPDVLVLDVYMPDVKGPELAAIVRERDDYLSLPILFLSSETDMSQQLLALNLGGDDFLVKPIQPEHLVSAVIARARRARQNAAIQNRLQTILYEREREHLALNFHAIVSVADARGIIIHANNRFCEVSGYSRAELLGQDHSIVKSGEHSSTFYRDLWRTITQGQVWQGEICNRRKDGSLYWVYSTITPFMNDDGKPYQYVSVRTDITEVKAKEAEELARSAMRSVAMEVAAALLAAESDALDAAIEAVLCQIGKHLKVDRAYLFLLSEDELSMSNTHEWCAPDITAQKEDLQNMPLDVAPWWWRQILQHRYVLVSDVAAMPAEAAMEQALFESLGIRALCGFPIRRAEQTLGFLGFDQINTTRSWDQPAPELLSLLAGLIGSALMRKKSDLHAQEAKERLRRGQRFANIGTWEWNIIKGDVFWTERVAPLFGYSDGELNTSYNNFLAAVHPDDRQSVVEAVNACVEHDTPYDIEHRVIWPDGRVRWLQERGAVVRDPDGNPIRMLGVVQDIDDRKMTEQTLQIFKHVVNSVVDGVLVIDTQGRIQLASPAASRIFGYDQSDMEGRNVSMLMPEPMHSEHNDYLKRYLTTNEPRVINRQIEISGERADGTVFPLEVAVTEIQLEHERYFVGLMRDITERKNTETALIKAREEADRANQAKSDFLSSMSHELRTPMNAILGFGQLMEYDESLPEEHQDNAKEILKAGEHLLSLINEVLDLAKVESGRIDLSLESVMVRPVVEECLTLVSTPAQRRQVELDVSGVQATTVRADRTRFKQALINLLSNAIKYNREGGRVVVDTQPAEDNRLRLQVTDTGPGIAEDRLAELFKPFNRLDADQTDIEGTGIGLVITRRIIDLMGGAVGVCSEPGLGSTFWIELPLEAWADNEADEKGTDSLAPGPSDDSTSSDATQKQTLLYIEDNPANLKLVTQILGRVPGVHLLTAHTPSLGIELAMARQPDLILLDINLPGMDGYQVLEVLKADDRLRRIPVIAVTANAMPNDVERGKTAGFAEYLTKPLQIASFLETIEQYFREHPGREAQ